VPTRMLDNEKRALVFTPGRKFDLHSGARKCPGSRVYRIAFRALDLLASESSSVLVLFNFLSQGNEPKTLHGGGLGMENLICQKIALAFAG
jgi:hypothetical protein